MTKLLRSLVLPLIGLFAVLMLTGCGGEDDRFEAELPIWLSVNPPSGSEIAANGTITVTFPYRPSDVTVSAGTVTLSGKNAIITGPFIPGALSLTITWDDGTDVFHYTVTAPCCAPPVITGGTVKDGDTDVDPEPINSDGKIEIHFSEEVTGNIALQTEGGADVGWLGKVEGTKATLELVKGRELGNETVYVIAGRISTADGIQNDIEITFVTKGKA